MHRNVYAYSLGSITHTSGKGRIQSESILCVGNLCQTYANQPDQRQGDRGWQREDSQIENTDWAEGPCNLVRELFPTSEGAVPAAGLSPSASHGSFPPYAVPVEQRATLGRGVVVRVRVALAAVLHQEGRVVPGHAEDAVRLVQEDVRQHPAVAVHDDHLPVGRAEQHLQVSTRTADGQEGRPPFPTHLITSTCLEGQSIFGIKTQTR